MSWSGYIQDSFETLLAWVWVCNGRCSTSGSAVQLLTTTIFVLICIVEAADIIEYILAGKLSGL